LTTGVEYGIFHTTQTVRKKQMPKAPVFTHGEMVVITHPVDDHYLDMTGVVMEEEYRDYINEYVYYVRLDNDGYEMEFTADELTLEEDV
jgi:ribonuclease BN (tRNA processing enzyme)